MNTSVPTKIGAFFSEFPHKSCKKGEIIVYPDEQPAGAFYIKQGYVREYSISVEGVEVTIHIFAPHTFFPMTWVIGDIKNRYYYEAFTDLEVYSASKEKVKEFLHQNPDVVYDLTTRLLHGLDRFTTRIEQLAHAKASIRMISTVLFLVRHFGKAEGSTVTLTEKFTHREIAAFAGVTRETASREWEQLKRDRLISQDNHHIIIPDLKKLQEKFETA